MLPTPSWSLAFEHLSDHEHKGSGEGDNSLKEFAILEKETSQKVFKNKGPVKRT